MLAEKKSVDLYTAIARRNIFVTGHCISLATPVSHDNDDDEAAVESVSD